LQATWNLRSNLRSGDRELTEVVGAAGRLHGFHPQEEMKELPWGGAREGEASCRTRELLEPAAGLPGEGRGGRKGEKDLPWSGAREGEGRRHTKLTADLAACLSGRGRRRRRRRREESRVPSWENIVGEREDESSQESALRPPVKGCCAPWGRGRRGAWQPERWVGGEEGQGRRRGRGGSSRAEP
jgi:hypothetical protein